MRRKRREAGLHPGLWTVILLAVIIGGFVLTLGAFNRDFSPRQGDPHLGPVWPGDGTRRKSEVAWRTSRPGCFDSAGRASQASVGAVPEQLKYIPANVGAEITATTAFGAKYVDLLTPTDPSRQRLRAGAVVESRNVTTEVNTVFQNLVGVLNKVDVAKLNAILTALADGSRQGAGHRRVDHRPQPGSDGGQSPQ